MTPEAPLLASGVPSGCRLPEQTALERVWVAHNEQLIRNGLTGLAEDLGPDMSALMGLSLPPSSPVKGEARGDPSRFMTAPSDATGVVTVVTPTSRRTSPTARALTLSGCSVVETSAPLEHPPLADVAAKLAQATVAEVRGVVRHRLDTALGDPPHVTHTERIVLVVEGTEHWRFSSSVGGPARAEHRTQLRGGDYVYIPPGWSGAATSPDARATTLHLWIRSWRSCRRGSEASWRLHLPAVGPGLDGLAGGVVICTDAAGRRWLAGAGRAIELLGDHIPTAGAI